MKNQIYQAFVDAGLKSEADRLSETIETLEDGKKIVPAIGHYIALAEDMGAIRYQEIKNKYPEVIKDAASSYPEKYALLSESIAQINNYVANLTGKNFEDYKTKIEPLQNKVKEFFNEK